MLSSEQQVMGEEKQRQGAERMKTADKNLPDQRDASWKGQFIPHLFDLRNQQHSPRDRAAMKAVVTLLAHSTAAWLSSTEPLEMAPRITAATAARSPTTVAWTWGPKDSW